MSDDCGSSTVFTTISSDLLKVILDPYYFFMDRLINTKQSNTVYGTVTRYSSVYRHIDTQ